MSTRGTRRAHRLSCRRGRCRRSSSPAPSSRRDPAARARSAAFWSCGRSRRSGSGRCSCSRHAGTRQGSGDVPEDTSSLVMGKRGHLTPGLPRSDSSPDGRCRRAVRGGPRAHRCDRQSRPDCAILLSANTSLWAHSLLSPRACAHLDLLLTLLAATPQAATDQKPVVPEGTIITSAQVTGFDIHRLSPGLRDGSATSPAHR